MKFRKAQAWGFDLAMAVTIFLVGLLLFFFYVLNFPSEKEETFNILGYEAKLIGDSLLSEGFPNDWSASNVLTIGITSNGKINDTKLKNFYDLSNSNYKKTQRLFNVKNDYYVFFEESIVVDGTIIDGIGQNPLDQKNLLKVNRVAVHGNKIKSFSIYVWN